ncbi:MAG: UDP-N-acetylmuramate--L-alanine ligase [Tepidisphaerales bacterium]
MPLITKVRELGMRTESRQNSRFSGKRIHFIGIGGCGMSGLARVLLDAGAIVTGTDAKASAVTIDLAERGARVTYVQDGAMLNRDMDLVVRTAAIPEYNEEYQRACELGLPQMKYAQLLGEVMRERLGIAVSGTHGKTTTTSMVSLALLDRGADPSFVIGGTVKQLGGSSRSGGGAPFVVEACEFDRSFHNYHPKVAVITNIDKDHIDFYKKGLAEIVESFEVFARLVPPDGVIIANGQDKNVLAALLGIETRIEWVGMDDVANLDWAVRDTGLAGGCHTGDVFHDGELAAKLRLSVPGEHNLFNATAAIAACAAAGLLPAESAEAIGTFRGADRRMTPLGRTNGAMVVDDYGHHPTEIRTTLKALREMYSPSRLICVFQPHQHSRTRCLLQEFGEAFAAADMVVMPDIYAARDSDEDRKSISSADVVRLINHHGGNAVHMSRLVEAAEHVRQIARPGDVIVTMGAGNVWELACMLVGTKLEKEVA